MSGNTSQQIRNIFIHEAGAQPEALDHPWFDTLVNLVEDLCNDFTKAADTNAWMSNFEDVIAGLGILDNRTIERAAPLFADRTFA